MDSSPVRLRRLLPIAAATLTWQLFVLATPGAALARVQGAPAAEPGNFTTAADLGNQRASAQTPINSTNVAQLRSAWKIVTPAPVSHTPLINNGRAYFADWAGNVYAADVATGQLAWQKKVQEPRTDWAWYGFAGVGAIGQGMLFEASVEGNAFALDLNTGDVKWQTKLSDYPTAGNLSQLLYNDGLVYIGMQSVDEPLSSQPGFKSSFRGSVIALDAATGKKVWEKFTVQAPGNGVAVWSSFAVDPAMNALFYDTGNNYTGDPTDLSDAVVAVNAKTGDLLWSRQILQNDVWTIGLPLGPDWDFSGGPQLFDANVNGQVRQLVGAAQKSGIYWAFDRRTGEVVWRTGISSGGVAGGLHGEASIGGDKVYIWGNNAFDNKKPITDQPLTIKALDAGTGKVLWDKEKVQPPVLKSAGFLANDVYFVGSLDGMLRGYRASDGQLVFTGQQGGSISGPIMVAGDGVFYGTGVPKLFGGNGAGQGVIGYRLNATGTPGTAISGGGGTAGGTAGGGTAGGGTAGGGGGGGY